MKNETVGQRSSRIIEELNKKYPGKKAYDLDGRGTRFVAEIEPVDEHPEYDRAVEVIIASKPHKHLKTTQKYKILSGNLELHVDDRVINLKTGDEFTVLPGKVHSAKSNDETWVEIYSEPGWTKEDHIVA